ncbi:MAG: MerR family transcriptional regulator [Candidatus Obscuribacterales bacterium]|nr:MerR family transcriptional regulator [Candidatus Obscuribacterales bacterium]
MSKTSSTEGTKIAQAAKELNVTSVTIRRYIAEFDIETETDENGIKVLPEAAITELQEIRKLKEDGTSNPQVMERLEELRTERGAVKKPKTKAKDEDETSEVSTESESEGEEEKPARTRRPRRVAKSEGEAAEAGEETVEVASEEATEEGAEGQEGGGRVKHSLTCQTCSKVFEHMNPRLRDCLECYRAKRKERRRGGDRQKNVIQHPLAAQVASKSSITAQSSAPQTMVSEVRKAPVRSYRKAIEDTRHITSNIKRRLERPDLGEGERRWLEQIYAYQLILHQGWRHLAEYKSGSKEQASTEV